MADMQNKKPGTKPFRRAADREHTDRKPYGEHKSSFSGEKKSFGDRKPYGDRKPSFDGEKRSFGDRKPAFGDKKPFGDRKPSFDGEKRSFSDRKPAFGDKKPFGDRKPSFDGEKRSFGDRKPAFGDKKPFGDRKPAFGEKKPFGDRKPAFGEKKPFGDRRPAVRPAPKAAPVSDGMPSRRMALEILRAVTENQAYASLELNSKLTKSGLSPADRRLVARLVYDTLEHLTWLDWMLSQVMSRPDSDIKLKNCLRLGACQILLEDRIPESAATNTTVNLCKEVFKAAGSDDASVATMASVCNGVLRSLVRQKDHISLEESVTDPLEYRSIKYSVPAWVVRMLDADYGEETANAILAAHAQEDISIRPNLTRVNDADFAALLEKKVWEKEPGTVPHSWKIKGMADVGADADFIHGLFSIQSESSMMAAMAVAPRNGWQILDACAAPGGKACYLGEMMQNTGRVQAWELHQHRTELITAQARRLQLDNVRPMTRDASVLREDLVRTMDAVLLDAPCSGLGNLADKPDVRQRVKETDVAELTQLQTRLLDAVCEYVKPGGVLVYSTCSLLKDENERQIEAFLLRHPDFKLDSLPDTIPAAYREKAATGLQLLPGVDGTTGFYLCRMKRSRV